MITSDTSSSVVMTTEEAMRLLNLAASLLQANIKMFLQRKKYLNYLKRYKSAVKIQSLWKGYHTRNLNQNIIKLKNDHFMKVLQLNLSKFAGNNHMKLDFVMKQQSLVINIIQELLKDKINIISSELVKDDISSIVLLDSRNNNKPVLIEQTGCDEYDTTSDNHSNKINIDFLIKDTADQINKLISNDVETTLGKSISTTNSTKQLEINSQINNVAKQHIKSIYSADQEAAGNSESIEWLELTAHKLSPIALVEECERHSDNSSSDNNEHCNTIFTEQSVTIEKNCTRLEIESHNVLTVNNDKMLDFSSSTNNNTGDVNISVEVRDVLNEILHQVTA